jgi:hypothetical protein
MPQARTGLANDARDVSLKAGMIDRVHPHGDAGRRVCLQGQFGHQGSVLGFAAHRGTIFAIQGDIKHASAEFLQHLGLQLQAFAHADLNAAVVVTDR